MFEIELVVGVYGVTYLILTNFLQNGDVYGEISSPRNQGATCDALFFFFFFNKKNLSLLPISRLHYKK